MQTKGGAKVEPRSSYRNTWLEYGKEKYVSVLSGGIQMRYIQAGKGQPLVLIHSLRTQADYFERLIPLLKGYTVYAMDLPGFGYSSIPDGVTLDEPFFRKAVVGFIRALDLRDVVLIGESIGATLSLTASTEVADRVDRVVALNPYDYGERFGGGIRRGKFGFIIGIFVLLGRYTMELKPLLRLVLISGVANSQNIPEHLVSEFHHVGLRSGYRRFEYRVFKNWRSWLKALALYKQVSVPVTLVYGERDWSRPAEREDRRKRLSPETYKVLPNVGHFSALEAPEALTDIIGR